MRFDVSGRFHTQEHHVNRADKVWRKPLQSSTRATSISGCETRDPTNEAASRPSRVLIAQFRSVTQGSSVFRQCRKRTLKLRCIAEIHEVSTNQIRFLPLVYEYGQQRPWLEVEDLLVSTLSTHVLFSTLHRNRSMLRK